MEVEQLRTELRALEKKFVEIKEILNEVHAAIIGNPLTKDGGIVARLSAAEDQLVQLESNFLATEKRFEERMILTEKKQIKYNIYTIVMWTSLGGVAMAVFLYVLDTILHRPNVIKLR